MADEHHHNDHSKVTIVVHDEDSGRTYRLQASSTDSVQQFIELLYAQLNTTKKPDDRLRCEHNGDSVFEYATLTIEDFVEHHCSAHQWLFASGTGGA